ncbi:MAG: RNA polymerase sigma factor, partial [Acidimicrobiia bacterium]|nr:RNA polymerase sigma factor [Acidimicrobiia bacterium]
MATRDDVDRIFRAEHARAVSVLAGQFGIDLAEDGVADAFATALRTWPERGVPPRPAGWILTTARNRVIDHLRRESTRHDRHVEADLLLSPEEIHDEHDLPDDRLRLIFTCCHPALSPEARVALTLRLVGGLTTEEIARGFVVPVPTMAARTTRAKAKIRDASIPYRVPGPDELPERLDGVLAVLYLIFTEGYASTAGERLSRDDLCDEAVRLTRLVVELLAGEPEVTGLLALMLFSQSRRPARTGPDGELVLLRDQDRSRWDRELIGQAHALLRSALAEERTGHYQLQAAIQAVHCSAPTMKETDWPAVLTLYDQLLLVAPGPVTALHRAVAFGEVHGPQAALELVDEVDLAKHHLHHAVRADLLARLDRSGEAIAAYAAAIELAKNEPE